MAEKHINARGLQCPGPIVQLFNAVKTLQGGDEVIIEATDMGFKKDIAAWAKKTGHELVELQEADGVITARLRVKS